MYDIENHWCECEIESIVMDGRMLGMIKRPTMMCLAIKKQPPPQKKTIRKICI